MRQEQANKTETRLGKFHPAAERDHKNCHLRFELTGIGAGWARIDGLSWNVTPYQRNVGSGQLI